MVTTIDTLNELPAIPETYPPREFSQPQINSLVQFSRRREPGSRILRVLDRIRDLRGTHITWGFNLALSDLVPRPACIAKSHPQLVAPLTLFKIHHHSWVPKVIIQVMEDVDVDARELLAYHTTCRSAGIEFMCITRPLEEYLPSNDFKRAFNGAFFCEQLRNHTIFCPALRSARHFAWRN